MGQILNPSQQRNVSNQSPLPSNNVSNSSSSVSASTEASITFQYNNSGVLANDAGQAAGVPVLAKLAFNNIRSEIGNSIANYQNTSLTFTSTAFTTEVAFPFNSLEINNLGSEVDRLLAITANLTNGEYCVDYASGTLYGIKASTQTAITTVDYMIGQENVSGTFVLPPDINLQTISGSTVSVDTGNSDAGTQRVVVASDQPSIPVSFGGNSTVRDGTGTLAATNVAEQIIVASTTTGEVTVQNDLDNSNDMFVGNATSQSIQLAPGMSYTLNVDNANKVYVKGTIGDRFNWGGTD